MQPTLPLELLEKIIVLCPRGDFPALSRTNQDFRGIVEHMLYINISLSCSGSDKLGIDTYFKLLGLYETLKNNQEKAALVRDFEVLNLPCALLFSSHPRVSPLTFVHRNDEGCAGAPLIPEFTPIDHTPLPNIPPTNAFLSIHRPILAVISVLPNLHVLRLHASQQDLNGQYKSARILRCITCPTLRKLEVDFPGDELRGPLPYLFQRHPELVDVRIRVASRLALDMNVPLVAPVLMHNLTRFEAPASYFDYLDEMTPLEYASVNLTILGPTGFGMQELSLEGSLPRLRLFATLKSLCITTESLDSESIRSIAKQLPNLEKLEFRHTNYVARLPLSMVCSIAFSYFHGRIY